MYLTHPDSASAIGASIATSGHVIKSVVLSIHGGLVQSCCYQRISSLEEVVVPDGVTEIGCAAFESCCSLRRVVLPKTLKKIHVSAFSSCANLEECVLPDGLEEVEAFAFRGCEKLKIAKWPSSLQRIGREAFAECKSIVSGVFPQSICEIGESAFRRCEKIERCELPDSLEMLGKMSFAYCSGLKDVAVSARIVELADWQFAGCESLERIVLRGPMKRFRWAAFSDCPRLQTIDVYDIAAWCECDFAEDGFTIRRRELLSRGLPLNDLEIPEKVISIASFAFAGYSNIKRVCGRADLTVVSDYSFSFCENLLDIDFEGIREIGQCAFLGCGSIESVTFSPYLQAIGERSFSGCVSLQSIRFKQGGKESLSLLQEAFSECSSLMSIEWPVRSIKIGSGCFRGCALEMFHPPAVEMELGPWAFESCKNLRSVTLPIGGSKISTCAFRGCDCITNLTVPCSSRAYVDQNDVEYSDPNRQSGTLFGLGCVRVLFLGNLSIWSALGTRELSELTVGEGVEKISSQFKGLNNLKTLKLPTSLKDVGDEAFAGLVGLQSFELPDSIESIGRNVFDGIPQGFVHRHDGVEYVGACAVGVDADDVERVVIEPGTCLISNAFHNCAQLREVVLPNSIRCIGTDAFSGCVSLESFVVPKGCKVIGGNAFGGCTILKNVYVPSSVERIGSSFCGCSPSLTFEVESVGRWASANYYAHYTGAYALTCRGDEVCDVTVAARNEYASRWSFKNCSSLRRASLDASVKELPKQAFYACASLAELTLTKGLRAVRQDACQGCKMLSSLSLPDGVEVIETWAFRDCPNIEDVRIPSSVVQVGWNVFHLYHSSARSDNDCSRCAPRILRLGSVNCFKFFDVRQVEEFELIEGAYQFGDGHFACKPEQYSKFEGFLHNKSLKKVVLPQSLRVLESYSFYDCPNLKSLKLPEGLVVMGDCIVEDYRKIEGGHPPRALACLGMFSRFGYGTEPADSLEIEDGLVYWGQWLVDEVDPMIKELKPREGTIGVRHGVKVLENLRYVVLPSSVKWIAPFAFGGCEKLERVDLPEGLEFIGDMAFSGCKLMREISLPFGLRIIGESVFSGCDMLREIHIPERVEYMHFDAFGFRDKGVSPRKIYIEGDPKLVSGFLPANKDRRDLLLPLLIERKEGPLLEREKYFANGSAYEEYYVTSKWSGVVDDGAEHRNYHIWQNNQSGPGTVTPSFQGDGVDDFQGELPF